MLADLRKAILSEARLPLVNLSYANLSEANLSEAILFGANLNEADLSKANLTKAGLGGTLLIKTDLRGASLAESHVYGASVWDIKVNAETKQQNLVIVPPGQAAISVDNIKVAQFIYLLLNNKEIKDVIDTITSKAVLILGDFLKSENPFWMPSGMSFESIITFRSYSTLTLQPIRRSSRRSKR